MTKEERHLWYDFLKELPVTVKRQQVIENYIVDFHIPSRHIIIELDGSQHYEGEVQQKDRIRDQFFKDNGFMVLRYSNLEVNQYFDAVCEDILKYLNGEDGKG